jgi:signal peptidase I
MGRRAWLLVGALLGVAALLSLRAFVGDLYRVESGSMEPTVRQGETVAVRYAVPRALERFQLVVFRGDDGQGAVVKRVGGLPGESLQIVDGDLVVDGAKLGGAGPQAPRVTLFDDRWHEARQFFSAEVAPSGPWTFAAGPPHTMTVDARAVPTGSDAGLAFWHKDLRDGYLSADGRRNEGLRQVNDGWVRTRFELLSAPELSRARLRWRLVEDGDTFELVLTATRAALLRRPGREGPQEILAEVPYELVPGAAAELSFANVDDRLEVRLDGALWLHCDYGGNRPFLGHTEPGARTHAPRVAFGAEGAQVRYSQVQVGRDLFYVGGGEYGVGEPVELALDEVFLLGDNSGASADSRYFGPVPLERLVGVPLAVVWPWRERRGLGR